VDELRAKIDDLVGLDCSVQSFKGEIRGRILRVIRHGDGTDFEQCLANSLFRAVFEWDGAYVVAVITGPMFISIGKQ